MGTKFFDVDDLKNWYRGKEGVSSKSRRMIEQISRMFDIPSSDGKAALRRLSSGSLADPQTSISTSASQTSIGGASEDSEESAGVNNTSNFLSYELCSIILNKLLKVHGEYQARFGTGVILTEESLKEKVEEKSESVPGVSDLHKSGIKGFLSRLFFKGDCVANCSQQTEEKVVAGESVKVKEDDQMIVSGPGDDEVFEAVPRSNFMVVESVPDTHRYRLTSLQPHNQKSFVKAVQKEVGLMRGSLPEGIFVKTYEDRMVQKILRYPLYRST